MGDTTRLTWSGRYGWKIEQLTFVDLDRDVPRYRDTRVTDVALLIPGESAREKDGKADGVLKAISHAEGPSRKSESTKRTLQESPGRAERKCSKR